MKFFSSILVFAVILSVSGQEFLKLTGQKNILKVQNLTANKDGSVSCTLDGKKLTAPPNSFDYARIPMPKEIAEAEKVLRKKDFVKAEKLFQIAYEKYHLLGWGIFCIVRRAEALDGANRLKEAIKILEQLKGVSSLDPNTQIHDRDARMLYVDLLIKSGDLKNAAILTESMLSAKDPAEAFFAFVRKGDIAAKQKQPKKAVRNYIQAIFLMPDQPGRPEPLYKAIVLLKEMKDPRWEKLADILKKQYPGSGYAKKL